MVNRFRLDIFVFGEKRLQVCGLSRGEWAAVGALIPRRDISGGGGSGGEDSRGRRGASVLRLLSLGASCGRPFRHVAKLGLGTLAVQGLCILLGTYRAVLSRRLFNRFYGGALIALLVR